MYSRYMRAGFLIDFISGPVNAGFTSAVAILILESQVKDMIGVKAEGSTLTEMIKSLLQDIQNFRSGDAILGSICIVVVLLLRVSGKKYCSTKRFSYFYNRASQIFVYY